MYLNSTLRRGLIIGGIALLAVVCVVALSHRNTTPVQAGYSTPLNSYGNPAPVAGAPMNAYPPAPAYPATPEYPSALVYGNPSSGPAENGGPVVYAASPFSGEYVAQPAPPPPPPAGVVEQVPPQPEYVRHYYWRHGHRVVVTERRPFSHSAAIVGGSAAGGAAVGAIAGGPEGAAVGALVGGAGGLVYDRLTHKKKKRVVVRY